MTAAVESWDDDADFHGDLFTHSVSTVQTSLSSRRSINSESNFGDEDWQVQVTIKNDDTASDALLSAQRAGIPLPANIPAKALVGGSITRLGKKNSRQRLNDEWTEDLGAPNNGGSLTLKPRKADASTGRIDEIMEEKDDFDMWDGGSLGIRNAGTNKSGRNRSSSLAGISPSLASNTFDNEDDDLRGLELPGVVDLHARLRERQAAEARNVSVTIPKSGGAATPANRQDDDYDDFFDDLDVGPTEDTFDPKKLTLHRNIKSKPSKSDLSTPSRLPMTTLTFTERPGATKIPRPVPTIAKPVLPKIQPVMEPLNNNNILRQRLQPTTTSAQLLRSKRSMPVMRSNYSISQKPNVPFLPGNPSTNRNPVQHQQSHLRRDSDPHRAISPPPRSFSRLSNAYIPDTPSRTSRRCDFASKDLAREASSKRTLTKPQKKKYFGDGTELEIFDDLPTSAVKESRFIKQPSTKIAPRTLRNIPSRLDLKDQKSSIADRPMSGLETPSSPQKLFQETSNTPRYLRDTTASRIARETRLANTVTNPRAKSSDGSNIPNLAHWKAQVAARSPHTSPSTSRNKVRRVQPGLIRPGDTNLVKNEKGMTFNPMTHRWEGNEQSLNVFDFPPPLTTPTSLSHRKSHSYLSHHDTITAPSPPRPALIAPMSATGLQVVGGMVFDPVRMCWLKFKPESSSSQSLQPPQLSERKFTPTTEDDDDDDPFAGIEDLKEHRVVESNPSGSIGSKPSGLGGDEWLVGEEFDLGPEFIRRQKEEEIIWRRRCSSWFINSDGGPRQESSDWRWRIREIAGTSR